jgi:hypothetical protein
MLLYHRMIILGISPIAVFCDKKRKEIENSSSVVSMFPG